MIHKFKNFIKRKYVWIIFTIFISIFIMIASFVYKKNIFDFDLKAYNFLVSHRNNVFNIFFKTITLLGNASILIIIAILSLIFLKNRKYKVLVSVNLAVIGLINYVLKHIFSRQRPNNLRLIEESGYSFPSGHAMASTAFYGVFIYIAYKHIENIKIRNITCILLSILILLIDISRVYVGVHYASDVVAGTCFSISYLIVVLKLINKKTNK